MQRVMRDSIMGNSGRHQLEYSSCRVKVGVRPTLVGVQQSGGEQQQPSSSTSSSTSRRIVVRRMESKVGVPCQAQQQHNDSQSGQSAGAPQAEGGSTKFSVLFIIFVKKSRKLTSQLNLERKMSQSLLQRRLLQPCRCPTSTIDHLVEISILGFQQGLELKQIYLQIERKKYSQRSCTWLLFDETMSLSEHV